MKKNKALFLKLLAGAIFILALMIILMNITANQYISTFKPENGNEQQKSIDAVIQKHVKENHFSGVVLVALEDQIIFNEGYGYARRFLNRTQNTPDSKFVIGSMTKAFTAWSILNLADQGLLSLQDKVTQFYPDYILWEDITVQNLLNHTSGIKNYYETPLDYMRYYIARQTPEKIISRFKNTPLIFKAGEDYQYSNTNYIILTDIIEKISGESYIDFLNHRLIEPMGLHSTGYQEYPWRMQNMAMGYCAGMIVEVTGFNLSNFHGAGGLYSSTHDIYSFLQGLNEEKHLNEKSNVHVTEGYYYGNGLMLEEDPELGNIYFHTGGGPGISTGMYKMKDQNVCIVVLGNNMQCSYQHMVKEICHAIKR